MLLSNHYPWFTNKKYNVSFKSMDYLWTWNLANVSVYYAIFVCGGPLFLVGIFSHLLIPGLYMDDVAIWPPAPCTASWDKYHPL